MLFLIIAYWPYVLTALILGIFVGWWYRESPSSDDAAAWLERGPDER